jgi:hypothetical protein
VGRRGGILLDQMIFTCPLLLAVHATPHPLIICLKTGATLPTFKYGPVLLLSKVALTHGSTPSLLEKSVLRIRIRIRSRIRMFLGLLD